MRANRTAVIILIGALLGSLAPNLIGASYYDGQYSYYDGQYSYYDGQYVSIPKEAWDRMCARLGNWTYAQFSHEYWAEHGGYGPSGVAWELAWGQIYYEQIQDLKAIGC